ncbi:MAG: hypothetical protein CMN77_18255 [Spirochaetaceae bacterium]|nr:hypothetical protein [Spirochaetaceae bacterium]|tara:strand:- start:8431 stop:9564 length:1134 start_codon:yes stop_codon:yes gene_type:complete
MKNLKPLYILIGALAFLFLLDKVFLIPEVRDAFMQPGGMVYYRHRIHQLDKYLDRKEDEKNRRTVVVLGDSRSFGIGTSMAELAGKKDVKIWNFSGPQAVPAYHLFLLERLLQSDRKPDAIILGLSPDALGRNAGIFASPVLNYGVDSEFIETYHTQIPDRDLDTYANSRRFAVVGMQFSIRTLIRRIRGSLSSNDRLEKLQPFLHSQNLSDAEKAKYYALAQASSENLSIYNFHSSPQIDVLDQLGGAQYAWYGVMQPEDLKRETDTMVSLYLEAFTVSEEQMFYLERSMKLIQEAGIPAVVFWPRVNPYLREVYEKEPKISMLWTRVTRMADRYGLATVDLNRPEASNCQHYYDASHLSIDCYPAITGHLLELPK